MYQTACLCSIAYIAYICSSSSSSPSVSCSALILALAVVVLRVLVLTAWERWLHRCLARSGEGRRSVCWDSPVYRGWWFKVHLHGTIETVNNVLPISNFCPPTCRNFLHYPSHSSPSTLSAPGGERGVGGTLNSAHYTHNLLCALKYMYTKVVLLYTG